MVNIESDHVIGGMGQKYHEGGQNRLTKPCQCFHPDPPFKTTGPGGIRPDGLPGGLNC